METTLLLAGIRFYFHSECELNIDPELKNFITSTNERADVSVRISREWDRFALPDTPQMGEDMICRYFQQDDRLYCVTRGNSRDPVACAVYGTDCREILCILNEKPFRRPPDNLGSILRMIPMRAIFQRFGVQFLHASRISHKGKGVLFSGPSGVGKTTQARLWHTYRGAEILCNDRTLLRRVDGIWHTYGYPLDGSEPVRSSAVVPLGCIVLLAQGSENHVERLKSSRGTALLMKQSVIDIWNPEARKAAVDIILSLMESIPVYLLTCTPDVQAVEFLEETLKKEGVILFE